MRKLLSIVLFWPVNIKNWGKMGPVNSCCSRPVDDKLMVTKMDLSHCGCIEVPHVVFNAERCIETLILASNQISSLPPQLFHCQEMKHLNLNDNCLSNIPPAIGSFLHLVSLKLDKNNLEDLPENLKMCKKLKRISLNSNPWKQMPNIVTQLISLEELYMNDCELNYLPASVGRLSKLKVMELRNNNLCNLPLSMTRLESLNRLDISDNEFIEFPSCISKLKSLKELLLDNNDIEEIIDIKNLVHLEHLDASYNHIIKISETIGCCSHLSILNLSFNCIEQLPNSIGNITYLQTLQIEMNELTEIPKSIGKLSYLEELILCNNKLHNLPSTIGLLRNLRNLNVSRNIVEEFPPEIGSCTKLGIISAAYNRLRVLPSEIGYLNNLKVLDLVGNFLMYLPITIINLRGVRAIWLSANQNIPLIPFTEDLNTASGERFLTNIALPQLGEIPLSNSNIMEKKTVHNEKTSIWNKKISFAENENILPGRLHRTPTPFPKELRSPNRKHSKHEELKRHDNYVNVIDGKVSEQETHLLLPTPVSLTSSNNEGANITDGCATQIREANIRRNHRELSLEVVSQNPVESSVVYNESEYSPEIRKSAAGDEDLIGSEGRKMNVSVLKEDLPSAHFDLNINLIQNNTSKNTVLPSLSDPIKESNAHEVLNCKNDKISLPFNSAVDKNTSGDNFYGSFRQQVIYSNHFCDDAKKRETGDNTISGGNIPKMNAQKIREMYHNDIIYGSAKNSEFHIAEEHAHYRSDYINDKVESPLKHLYSNDLTSRNYNSVQAPLNNINRDICKTLYCDSPVPHPSPCSINQSLPAKCESSDSPTPFPVFDNDNLSLELQQRLTKQDFISIAEQMKNRNISPPCYEIAKMYSTKAALFENSRVDQFKSN